jgi:hypothetical protein
VASCGLALTIQTLLLMHGLGEELGGRQEGRGEAETAFCERHLRC